MYRFLAVNAACYHTCIVALYINRDKYGFPNFLQRVGSNVDVFSICDVDKGLTGRKNVVLSAKPKSGNRYAVVWKNHTGELKCSLHQSRPCEHRAIVIDNDNTLKPDEKEQAKELDDVLQQLKIESVYDIPKQSYKIIPIPLSLNFAATLAT